MVNLGKCIGTLRGLKVFKEVNPIIVKGFKTNAKGIVKNAGFNSHQIQNTIIRFVDSHGNVTKTVSRSGITKSDLFAKNVKKDYSQLTSSWNLYTKDGVSEYKFANRAVTKMRRTPNGATSFRQVNLSPDGKHVLYTRAQDTSNIPRLYNDITRSYGFGGSNLVKSDMSGNPIKIMELDEFPPVWTCLGNFI